MRAVVCEGRPPSAPVMRWQEVSDLPLPGPDEVLIDVAAAGVNRADLLQRRGFYPPPPGESDVLGLECSGRIRAVGADVTGWAVGDEVCALLAGGGYAESVLVPAGQVLPIPAGVDLVTAAGLPEAAATVVSNLSRTAQLQPGEWLLVHGGGSGIGTFAVQYAAALGARVIVTAGSDEKLARCSELGATVGINYLTQDFVAEVKAATHGHGADVILDIIGAKYLEPNVRALAVGGRLVVIGLQGGVRGELDLGQLLRSQGTIAATSLRFAPADVKAEVCAQVVAQVWPMISDGTITPVIDRVVAIAEVAAAHDVLENSANVGKVLLQVAD